MTLAAMLGHKGTHQRFPAMNRLFSCCLAALCAALICPSSIQAAGSAPTLPAGHTRVDFLTPHPPYPLQARASHAEGRVTVRVTWAADGHVKEAVVVKSSGSGILDSNTREYIKAKWRSFVGKEVSHTLTLDYRLR